jgi:lysozyme family protein
MTGFKEWLEGYLEPESVPPAVHTPMPEVSKPSDDPFDECLAFTLREEGGYSNDPLDHGGATNFGITQKTLSDWRGHEVSAVDVEHLTEVEAGRIYRDKYWDTISGDELPRGVNLMLFDFGINSGWGTAARMLQRILDTDADGHIGPDTLALVEHHDPELLIGTLEQEQTTFYENLVKQEPQQKAFLKGWLLRTGRGVQLALNMARNG